MEANTQLSNHIQGAQDRATRLHGVLQSIEFLNNEDGCRDGINALIQIARENAGELASSLDMVNLPVGRNNE